MSREHYPGKRRGEFAEWRGRKVRLDDNARAQMAWAKYTQRAIARDSGFGVRHVWGNPWDPDVFTAGWNLTYMPYWAGCSPRRSTATRSSRKRSDKRPGTCSFGLILSASPRHTSPTPG